MRWSLEWTLCLVAALLAAILGGCSGAGESASQARGASVQALATNQVSSALLLKQVLLFLYQDQGMSFTAASPSPKASAVKPPPLTANPRKTVDIDLSDFNTDGSAFHAIQYTDGSGIEGVAWPDGRTKQVWWSPPTLNSQGNWLSYDGGETWGDGTVLAYTWNMIPDTARLGMHQKWAGSLTSADGKRLDFTVERVAMQWDKVRIDLPDATAFDTTIPQAPAQWKPFWPDFTKGFSGTYAGQQFTIKGTADYRWRTLDFAAADGETARYELGAGLVGSGQILQDGKLLGVMTWDATATGTLQETDQTSVAVTPTDAARRFAIDRWVHSIASMAPAPTW